jgi:diguanylate cyclase (GGDEF)-like protein
VLARYGGEEFALLLPEIDVKGATHLAEKLRKLVEKHTFTFDGETIPVTLSAGVAVVLKKSEDSQELIRRADEKLYEAKSAGRNRVAH